MRLIVCFWCLVVCNQVAPTLMAAPIQAGSSSYEFYTTYTTRLYPGTPFNPGPDPVEVPIESTGVVVMEWQDQVGDMMAAEAVSIVGNGGLGDPPIPFQALGGVQEVPALGPWDGSMLNIVQDSNDPGFATGDPSSLESALMQSAGRFALVLADGTVLYTASADLGGNVSGLPWPVGTQLTFSSEVEIRLQVGDAPDPVEDLVVGLMLPGGILDVTRLIPEPSTLLLALVALGVVGGWRKWKRTA